MSISARTHIQFVTMPNKGRIRKANRSKTYLANLDKEKAKSIERYNADALKTKADMRDYSKANYLVNPKKKRAASRMAYQCNQVVKKNSC